MGLFQKYFGLRGQALSWAIGAIAGLDFLLFGYDQGVMGGILTLPIFLAEFPSINPDSNDPSSTPSQRSTYQGIAVASYNLGCFIGAIIAIFIGNPLGRRKMIFLGTWIMVVGAILQASATTLPHFIVGRIITGLGNGGNTSTVPMWQSETSKANQRGRLVMIEGCLIAGGITISYWVDYGLSFAPGSVAWRFPLAFQVAFCIPILVCVLNLPESPRWLILKGHDEEAKSVIKTLSDEGTDEVAEAEYSTIKETVLEMSKGSFSDLWARDSQRTLHRTILAYVNQMFQQISGINLITYYAAVIYGRLGMSDSLSRLLAALNGTEYFLASWPAVFLVERVGRRKLMLIGAIGQAGTMAILAGVGSQEDNKACQIAGVVFLFVFNTFFAIGWLGMTWLYPAEITPLRTRAPANALSTSSNWIFNFIVVMITPVAFENIKYHTYTVFAAINFVMIPSVYFFFPETAYRSLEEMDIIFSKVKGLSGALTVIEVARNEPHHYDKDGKQLMAFDDKDQPVATHSNGSDNGVMTTTDEEKGTASR